jgi:hypothetical protein
MQLPRPTAGYPRRVSFGRYLARRLRAANRLDLSDSVKSATSLVKSRGRDWEDRLEPVQDAMADRDFADFQLDTLAQETRLNLASRSLNATKEAPYTSIFPAGSSYYTAAPVDQEVKRYNELVQRLIESLPADDILVTSQVPKIQAALTAYSDACAALDAARTDESIARTSLETAESDWEALVEKVYGSLISQYGKADAERFFPRRTTSAGSSDEAAPASS